MRLTTVILLASLMQVSAATFAQRITMTAKNVSLSAVLKEVRKQSGFDFYYDNKIIPKDHKISISVRNASLDETLMIVLQNLQLNYDVEGRIITISKKKEPSVFNRLLEVFSDITVRGRVVSEKGVALAGATVKVKGGNLSVSTDAKGAFSLSGVNEQATIIVSFVGYEPREIKASADMGDISLQPSNAGLNEVQVIGYGTTTQRLTTGSVKAIRSDEIGRQPVANPLLALQGNVAGMYISQNNGLPGSAMNVSIRGQNSIGAGNSPLYIVDGVPFDASPVNMQAGGAYSMGAQGETSPFNSINPTDIESISILKDADATAIYGSRGANGVVLITTKKGKAGQTRFSGNLYTGLGNVASKIKMLNSDQYLALRREAFANDGEAFDETNAPDLTNWGTGTRDFQKELIGKTSRLTEGSFSISGGEKNTVYLLSGTYRNEGTVFPGDKSYQRGSALLNLNHVSVNERFKANVSVSFSKDVNNLTPTDLTNAALMLPPNYPLYNADGSFYQDNNFQNPLAANSNPFRSRTENLNSNIGMQYRIVDGLELKTSFGYSKMSNDQRHAFLKSNSGLSGFETISVMSANFKEGVIIEPQVNYDKIIGIGKLQIVVGGTYQQSRSEKPYFQSLRGFSSEKMVFNRASAQFVDYADNSSSDYKYASVFGRVNYQIKQRYIVNLSARRDGSSRFGPNNRFGNFGAVGVAWIFSEEDFFKSAFNWISFGKLRASYGAVGNDQIADYGYLSTYRSNNFSYGGTPSIYPARLANPDYSWESTNKIDLALDLGFLKDRILFSVTAYRNRTNNMLVNRPLSHQTGFTSYQANLPAMVQNSGLELELNTTNIQNDDFSWKTSFNLTIPRNKLLSFPGISNSSYANSFIVGQPLGILNMYHLTGIVDGIPQFQDLNGDGQISSGVGANDLGDYVTAGQLAPRLFGGLSNNLRYKNWQLDMLLQFSRQKNYSNRYLSESPPGSLMNQDAEILNLGLRPTATFGTEAYDAYLLYSNSDAVISDASFLRLKNVSLSYSLPEKITKRLKMDRCNLYLRGQNCFTITNYQGLDPETLNDFGHVLPPLRMYMFGIQFSL